MRFLLAFLFVVAAIASQDLHYDIITPHFYPISGIERNELVLLISKCASTSTGSFCSITQPDSIDSFSLRCKHPLSEIQLSCFGEKIRSQTHSNTTTLSLSNSMPPKISIRGRITGHDTILRFRVFDSLDIPHVTSILAKFFVTTQNTPHASSPFVQLFEPSLSPAFMKRFPQIKTIDLLLSKHQHLLLAPLEGFVQRIEITSSDISVQNAFAKPVVFGDNAISLSQGIGTGLSLKGSFQHAVVSDSAVMYRNNINGMYRSDFFNDANATRVHGYKILVEEDTESGHTKKRRTTDDKYRHGTHVAGTVGGRTDGQYGIAPDVELSVVEMGFEGGRPESVFYSPYMENNVWSNWYRENDGPRSFVNSWSQGFTMAVTPSHVSYDLDELIYGSLEESFDAFVEAHPKASVFFAGGNQGFTTHSVAKPSTAKNVFSVAATFTTYERHCIDFCINYIPNYGNCKYTCSSSYSGWNNDAEHFFSKLLTERAAAMYSAKGPTWSGRFKPDITAPGHPIHSTGGTVPVNVLTGTSMSCPVSAGVEVVIRQALTQSKMWDNKGAVDPSSALMRAILINSALKDFAQPQLETHQDVLNYFSDPTSEKLGVVLHGISSTFKSETTSGYRYVSYSKKPWGWDPAFGWGIASIPRAIRQTFVDTELPLWASASDYSLLEGAKAHGLHVQFTKLANSNQLLSNMDPMSIVKVPNAPNIDDGDYLNESVTSFNITMAYTDMPAQIDLATGKYVDAGVDLVYDIDLIVVYNDLSGEVHVRTGGFRASTAEELQFSNNDVHLRHRQSTNNVEKVEITDIPADQEVVFDVYVIARGIPDFANVSGKKIPIGLASSGHQSSEVTEITGDDLKNRIGQTGIVCPKNAFLEDCSWKAVDLTPENYQFPSKSLTKTKSGLRLAIGEPILLAVPADTHCDITSSVEVFKTGSSLDWGFQPLGTLSTNIYKDALAADSPSDPIDWDKYSEMGYETWPTQTGSLRARIHASTNLDAVPGLYSSFVANSVEPGTDNFATVKKSIEGKDVAIIDLKSSELPNPELVNRLTNRYYVVVESLDALQTATVTGRFQCNRVNVYPPEDGNGGGDGGETKPKPPDPPKPTDPLDRDRDSSLVGAFSNFFGTKSLLSIWLIIGGVVVAIALTIFVFYFILVFRPRRQLLREVDQIKHSRDAYLARLKQQKSRSDSSMNDSDPDSNHEDSFETDSSDSSGDMDDEVEASVESVIVERDEDTLEKTEEEEEQEKISTVAKTHTVRQKSKSSKTKITREQAKRLALQRLMNKI